MVIQLNITQHEYVGGAVNIDNERKKTILEAIDSTYLEDAVKVSIITSEVFDEILERELDPENVSILMEDSDIINLLVKRFSKWDIDAEILT